MQDDAVMTPFSVTVDCIGCPPGIYNPLLCETLVLSPFVSAVGWQCSDKVVHDTKEVQSGSISGKLPALPKSSSSLPAKKYVEFNAPPHFPPKKCIELMFNLTSRQKSASNLMFHLTSSAAFCNLISDSFDEGKAVGVVLDSMAVRR